MAEVLGAATTDVVALVDDESLGRLAADMPSSVADKPAALRALREGLRQGESE